MIGVASTPAEEPAVREFFELFKTPWEFYRADHAYSVVLCSGGEFRGQTPNSATPVGTVAETLCGRKSESVPEIPLVLIYSAERTSGADVQEGTHVSILGNPVRIKGNVASFGEDFIRTERTNGQVVIRVGYNLFQEVEALLAVGQSGEEAQVPALDLHIALLRNLMTENGACFLEIPPVPEGYAFAACLTHDLDHASIRRHGFDSTVVGFLFRATFGSIANLLRGRLTLGGVFTNWMAALRLPFTQLGLAQDFWGGFDRYLELEEGRPSTFFVIPFENLPGRPSQCASGAAPSQRGSRYDVSHVAHKLPVLQAAGCEVGLHGIDAWADSSDGAKEARRISTFSGRPVAGVRMHWLYRDDATWQALDGAEFSYDSSSGFNETVGYRAGTAQVFKPVGVKRLMELPLHVMDTALFYPDYMNLSMKKAGERLKPMLDHVSAGGGTFTVNWHDRSIAPERLWGGFYRDLVKELSRRNAWFCTGGQAVSWFRKRRSASFERDGDDGISVRVAGDTSSDSLPGLRLRVVNGGGSADGYSESALATGVKVRIRSGSATEILERS